MHLEKYALITGVYSNSYEFWSEGPKGRILKLIEFQTTDLPNLYNLAFGDVDITTGKMDDRAVTNNGDTEKVLATLVSAVFSFTNIFPNASIYATGSTPARTRLYQIGIGRYLNEVQNYFEIRARVLMSGSFTKEIKFIVPFWQKENLIYLSNEDTTRKRQFKKSSCSCRSYTGRAP